MREADIPGGDRLRELANWNQTPGDWARLLSWEPDGCFLAEQAGRILGTVTTTTFGRELAWIGMMLVDPEARRRGIARRLLREAIDWLERTRGLHCIGLDATPIGKTLYDTMEFADVYSLQRWEGVAPDCSHPRATHPPLTEHDAERDHGVRLFADDDVERIRHLDARAVGVDRIRVIRDVVAAYPAGCFVLQRGSEVAGYACSRPGARRWYIGPVVATDPEAGHALLRAVLAPMADQPVVIDIIDSNDAATGFARGLGFEPVRPFIRMVRGSALPTADRQLCFAIVGPEVG
jgi:GNAT superfamily N-acetyltransferase